MTNEPQVSNYNIVNTVDVAVTERPVVMTFFARQKPVSAGGKAGTAVVIGTELTHAEIWPSHGFNCLRWQCKNHNDSWNDLLYTAPDWETNPVPTRSGHPILFPFPNRMKHGRFSYDGQVWQLPLNESTGLHAIHGFTPRSAWRLIDYGTDGDSAFVTGEFQLSVDAPHAVWPADARIRVTYTLKNRALKVDAIVDAADGRPLPFGLGYHPYFRVPGSASSSVSEWELIHHATKLWETDANMPDGRLVSIPEELDFTRSKRIGHLQLDHLYDNSHVGSCNSTLNEIARLQEPDHQVGLSVCVDNAWSTSLLFTPPHRQAIAIEPYTCTTDAANLANAGIASGWQILPSGEQFHASVEYRLLTSNQTIDTEI